MIQTPQAHDRDEFGYPLRPDSRRQLRNRVVSASRRILLTCISVIVNVVGVCLWLGRLIRKFPPLTPARFHPSRILVIRLDLIGDLVLTLPLIQTLKRTYPVAEIDLLATPASSKVVAFHPALSEIIAYDPNLWRRPQALFQRKNWREARALRRRLLARDYDLVICAYGSWAAIIAVLSGAPRRVGFAKEGYLGLLTDVVPGGHWQPNDRLHEVDYGLQLAHAAGASVDVRDRVPYLTIDQQSQQQVAQLLEQEHLDTNKLVIACHVASHNGQSKRWPVPYWARLIDRLICEEGASVVLTGAASDLPFITEVIQRMQEQPLNLAGKTTLLQLAALLQRVDLLITGDSGPMHVCAAVGTPLIAIHGPTDPALSGPLSPMATVVRDTIWCSPCYAARGPADCRFFTTQCMKNITPDQIFTLVHEKLSTQQELVE